MKELKRTQIFQLTLYLIAMTIINPFNGWSQGLEIDLGTDVTLAGGGYIIIEEANTALEMAFDGNEIMTRFLGVPATLHLNRDGGSVRLLDNGGDEFSVNGNGLFFDLSTNRLGIGNSVPSSRLDVSGNVEISGNLDIDNGSFYFDDVFNRVGIGTSTPTAPLQVEGEIQCNGLMDINGDLEVGGVVDIDNGNLYYDDVNNRLGIGTSTPGARLDVEGEIECNGQFDLNGPLLFEFGTMTSTAALAIDCSRRFEPTTHILRDLGQATNFRAWDDVFADNFVNVSDMRLKSNVTDSDYGLDELLQLNPIRYLLNDDLQKEFKLGLSAQEVLAIIPEVVKSHDIHENENGDFVVEPTEYLGLKYSMFVPVIINAIKELDSKIEVGNIDSNGERPTLDLLRSENEELKERLEKLEKQIQVLFENK